MTKPDHPNPLLQSASGPGIAACADGQTVPALTAMQCSILLASAMLVAGGVMGWNALTGHAVTPPVPSGGLDPTVIARNGVDASALHWVSIRFDGEHYQVDFAPILADAAALQAVRYGVDQAVPDRVLALPANRHLWPVPPDRLGDHVLQLPATSQFVSVSVTYNNGESSPVLLYPLTRSAS